MGINCGAGGDSRLHRRFVCDNTGCGLTGRLPQNTSATCGRRDAHLSQSAFNEERHIRVPNKLDFTGCLIGTALI